MEQEKQSMEGSEIQRWTAKRKTAVVLDLIRGKTTAAEIARQHDLSVAEVEQWQHDIFSAAEKKA